jgi:hypothetical protein
MPEYQAIDVVLQLLSFSHVLGESILSRIEFWSGISYGLIVIAYLAPARLTLSVTIFLLVLYGLFTFSVLHNINFDMETSRAALNDVLRLVEEHNLNLEAALHKAQAPTSEEFKMARGITNLYLPGLFLGTIGFVGGTCFVQRKAGKSK